MLYTNEFVDVFQIRRFLWSLIKIVGGRNCIKDVFFLEFAVFRSGQMYHGTLATTTMTTQY